jgi:16S rRNA processing protein RimM
MRLIPIGQIVTCHGTGGFVRLRPYNRPASPEVAAARRLYIGPPGGGEAQPRAVEAMRPHRYGLLVKLAGIDDRTAAGALVGCEAALPEAALPAPRDGEFYYYEIVGYRVRTTAGAEVGTVRETFPAGGNDVWVVAQGPREHLIPVVAEVVRGIDRTARTVTIDPPPGLLDL